MTKRRRGAQTTDFATFGAPASSLETYFRLFAGTFYSPPVNPLSWDLGSSVPEPSLVEDRRRFYPGNGYTGWEAAKRLSGAKPFLQATPLRTPSRKSRPGRVYSPSRVAFEAPRTVVVCVRRKQRRQVLLALGRAGRGRRTYKRAHVRRNAYSSVGC
jgi:hypothetical protein